VFPTWSTGLQLPVTGCLYGPWPALEFYKTKWNACWRW